MKRHFGGHMPECLDQIVSGTLSSFNRTERMIDRLTPLAHLLRLLVESTSDPPQEHAHARNGLPFAAC